MNFCQVQRLRSYERISTENRRFRSNWASLTQNFREKGLPHQLFFFSKKLGKWSFIRYKNLAEASFCFVTNQSFDRQTHGRTSLKKTENLGFYNRFRQLRLFRPSYISSRPLQAPFRSIPVFGSLRSVFRSAHMLSSSERKSINESLSLCAVISAPQILPHHCRSTPPTELFSIFLLIASFLVLHPFIRWF